MSDTKQQFSWQTIALVALVGYVVWTNWKPASDDGEKPIVVESISTVLAKAYDADRKSKIAILKGITANEFASDEAKLNWINSEAERRRTDDFKAFSDRMAEAIFDGKTEEMAKALEAGK